MLIEFHVIQDHGPSNMNRGQDGRPKTAFYAGTHRLRVSSQCRKRTLRQPRPAGRTDSEPGVFEKTVGPSHFGVRTKLLPEKVAEKWVELHGADAPFVAGIKAAVSIVAKKDGKADEVKSDGRVRTPQAVYLELDREVDRIVDVLSELHQAGDLEKLADESQVFADFLKDAARAVGWDGKDPSKTIAWNSLKKPENWTQVVEAVGVLDVPDQPEGFGPGVSPAELAPTYELAEGLLKALRTLESDDQNQDRAKSLLKILAPAKNEKKSSGAKIALADRLKLTADQPVVAADIALFGRMTTSDAYRDVEAACQVADSISTHPVDIETDYFTTVDDLDTGTGAAHVGEAEYSSAVFYHYLSIDFRALLRNLGGIVPGDQAEDEDAKRLAGEAQDTAKKAVEGLLRAVMLNVPSGKINSHAHNQPPSLIFVEVKQQHHATSFLTAFHEPARAGEREDGAVETLLTDSVRKLLSFARYRNRKMPIDGTLRFVLANDEPTEHAIERLRNTLKVGDASPLKDDEFFAEAVFKECDTFEELVTAVNTAVAAGGVQ